MRKLFTSGTTPLVTQAEARERLKRTTIFLGGMPLLIILEVVTFIHLFRQAQTTLEYILYVVVVLFVIVVTLAWLSYVWRVHQAAAGYLEPPPLETASH